MQEQMTASDKAVFHGIYPMMFRMEDELGEYISLKLWANLTRLMATRGTPLDRLQELLVDQYTAQESYNAGPHH